MGTKPSSKIQGKLTKTQKEELNKAKKTSPPAGIKYVKERKLPASAIRTSILILSRVLPADQQKIVEKAIDEQ